MNRVELARYVGTHFSTEEMQQICLELGVAFDDLRGGSKQAKSRELVIFLERRDRLAELEAYGGGKRPLPATIPIQPTPPPPQLNPYTITKLLHIFFTEDEINRSAATWEEQYGRFQPTYQQPLHPLVVRRAANGELQQFIDAAQKLHPELPWNKCITAPGLVNSTPPRQPDTAAIIKMIAAAFADRAAFDTFCRQHLSEFQGKTASTLSMSSTARELVQYMQRRRRLHDLLSIFQVAFPTHYQQYAPYERGEKPHEKQKREAQEKLALTQEAAKIVTIEVTRQEKHAPDGFILRQTLPLKTQRSLKSLAWIPGSNRLFTFAADGIIQTWDSATGEQLTHYQLNKKEIAHFAGPMPNGSDALLLAGPRQKNTLRIIELSSGKVRVNIPDVDLKAAGAAISADGKWAATKGSGNSLQVWHLAKAHASDAWHGHLQEVTAVLMQPTGNRVISASKDETIRIWNEKGETEHTLSGHNGSVSLMAVSPDGRFLAAVVEKSHEIFVWQLPQLSRGFMAQFRKESPQLVTKLNAHKGRVTALSFAVNGRFLASKSYDYTLRVWDCATWTITRQLMSTLGTGLAFHPKRPFLAVGSDSGRQIHIWELKL